MRKVAISETAATLSFINLPIFISLKDAQTRSAIQCALRTNLYLLFVIALSLSRSACLLDPACLPAPVPVRSCFSHHNNNNNGYDPSSVQSNGKKEIREMTSAHKKCRES